MGGFRCRSRYIGCVSSLSRVIHPILGSCGLIDYFLYYAATSLQTYPKETSTHLVLSALSTLPTDIAPTEESLRAAVQNIIGQDVELPDEFDNAVGEM